jgi:hypothetical protein
MKTSRVIVLALLAIAVLALGFSVSAQDAMAPEVQVADQVVLNGAVYIDYAYMAEPGFMVIHADSGAGEISSVIGHRQLSPGANYGFWVPIDTIQATSTLYAMLHFDTGEAGVYEFGTVEGADSPVVVDGAPVSPAFSVSVLNAWDQFLAGDTVTIASATVSEQSWLVIHSGDAASPGPVLGQTLLQPGTSADVAVTLAAEGRTEILWPMLHVDTGEVGTYEFGAVEGADGPIVINGQVATLPIWTVPHARVDNQIVTHGDGMTSDMAPTVTAKSVLSAGDGFLVIHQEADGGPGPVAGVSDPLPAGLSTNVVIELNPAMVTPNLWPMLHVDDNTVGTYEFGAVEGADGPVRDSAGNVVTFRIFAAPSIDYTVTQTGEGQVTIPFAMIDAPGWLVIHIDDGGGPGPVAGQAPLVPGANYNIVVTVDPAMMTATVFPMLHYDTGAAGVYEFGAVEGADGPVRVGDNVVVGPAEVAPGE